MRLPLTLIALSMLATGCASTGKLPTPSGTPKRINDTAETQALLSQSGIALIGPKATDRATVDHFMSDPIRLLSRQPSESDYKRMGAALVKKTVVVTFPSESAEFRPTGSQRFHMRELSARANRVEIRGRTSNEACTAGSQWTAKERAMSAQRYLLGHKMPSVNISINVMCSGDFVADNRTEAGRAENQRVELEFFFEGDPVVSFDPNEYTDVAVAHVKCDTNKWQAVGGTRRSDGCLK